jgi:hypothetical protein
MKRYSPCGIDCQVDIPYQLSRPFRFLRAMCPKIRAAHSEIESQ